MGARRSIAVHCPRRLPKAAWYVRYRSILPARTEYLCHLETRPSGSGVAYHVLAGGRRGPLPLGETDGHWPSKLPLESDLALVGAQEDDDPVRPAVLGEAAVAGHRGLLLQVAPFPDGGVHGGHLAVIWNQGGSGYVLSMHFSGSPTDAERRRALLGAAAAMSRSAAA